MKKLITISTFMFLSISLIGQGTPNSTMGSPILPEAKDFSISVDANPFLDYVGNMFNNSSSNTAPAFAFNADKPLSLYGKYFITDMSAYRATFRLGFSSSSDKDPDSLLNNDVFKSSDFNLALGLGKEWRRGKGRLQGIYGAEALINFSTASATFEYDNGDSEELSGGSSFGLSARAFVGVEYFFAPKMSIGAEYGYALGFSSTGATEYIGTFGGTKIEETLAGGNSFGLDTDASGFNLKLNFFF